MSDAFESYREAVLELEQARKTHDEAREALAAAQDAARDAEGWFTMARDLHKKAERALRESLKPSR